jgi:hypothetical protein
MNILAARICFAGRFGPDSSLNTWPGFRFHVSGVSPTLMGLKVPLARLDS